MIAQYSILKISFNEILQDEMSVGLFIDTGSEVWFEYSHEQLTKAKRLLPDNFEGLESYLKVIRSSVKNRAIKDNAPIYQALRGPASGMLNKLSIYNNNLIRITKPTPIKFDQHLDAEYLKFFREVFPSEKSDENQKSSIDHDIIKRDLIKPLVNKVHTCYTVNKNVLPGIYWSTELDCVGKNGSVYTAKHFDFTHAFQTIDRNFGHYRMIAEFFKAQYSSCVAFVLAPEPEVGSAKHNIWEFMKNDEKLELRDPEESEEVANIILDANAHKFLAESN